MSTNPLPIADSRGLALLKHYLIGGSEIGAGIAGATSLANYMNTLQDQAGGDGLGEDTLTLNIPGKKKRPIGGQEKMAVFEGTPAILGAAAGATGSYMAVRALYQEMKRRQQKADLEKAQQGYIGNLSDLDAQKSASVGLAAPTQGSPMRVPEMLSNAPTATAAVIALASAVLANRGLAKAFPMAKPPLRKDPRRVVIKTVDPEESSEDQEKEASYEMEDGYELAYRVLLAAQEHQEKRANLQYLADMTHAIGNGHLAQIEDTMLSQGPEACFTLVKGASYTPAPEPFYSMAIGAIIKSAALGPVMTSMLAAEYRDAFPMHCDNAAAMSPECQETMAKMSSFIGRSIRHEACSALVPAFADVPELSKEAFGLSDLTFPMELYSMAMERKNLQNTNKLRDHSQSGKSQSSNEEKDSKVPVLSAPGDASAKQFVSKNQDMVDQILSADKKRDAEEPQ